MIGAALESAAQICYIVIVEVSGVEPEGAWIGSLHPDRPTPTLGPGGFGYRALNRLEQG